MTALTSTRRAFLCLAGCSFVTACSGAPRESAGDGDTATRFGFTPVEGYESLVDNGYILPPVPPQYLEWPNRRQLVYYEGSEPAGNIVIDPYAKFLYYIMGDGTAWRYPIAVGRAGLALKSTTTIRVKKEWPGWTPTKNMVRNQPDVYGPFANGVPGGLASPLGARALYLYRGKRDSYFRIHGTNDMSSIGNSGSAGCIRLFNHDIIDLYDRVSVPTTVLIRSAEESLRLVGPEFSPRGRELPPVIVSPETIYGATDVSVETPIVDPDGVLTQLN
jgi:lipoprotein-anchoring transpeptidase ErfK/SrfK